MPSELVANPTPETHPDILKMCTVSATNNSILEAGSKKFFIFTPRNFTIVRDIKDHLDPIETQEAQNNRKTVGEALKDNAPAMLYALSVGGLEISFIIWLVGTLLPKSVAIVAIALIILICILGCIGWLHTELNEEPEPKATPDKDFLFLQIYCASLKDLDLANAHDTVVQTINAVHETDNRLLHNTDTFVLANAYDAYMDMLVFVLANKDKLSPRLVDKYVQSLLNKAEAVRCEAENVFDSIKTQEEFVCKATEESKRLHQEMVDSEAESIMPPD